MREKTEHRTDDIKSPVNPTSLRNRLNLREESTLPVYSDLCLAKTRVKPSRGTVATMQENKSADDKVDEEAGSLAKAARVPSGVCVWSLFSLYISQVAMSVSYLFTLLPCSLLSSVESVLRVS